MNKVYPHLLGAVLVSMSTSSAWAAACSAGSDGSYVPNGCDTITPAASVTLAPTAGYYIINRNPTATALTITDDLNLVANSTASGGFTGFSNQYRVNNTNFQNVNMTITGTSATGLGINMGGSSVTAKDVVLNINTRATGISGGETYGLVAGSAVNVGENDASYNGKYATITLDKLTLTQTTAGGLLSPQLNSGIRAIQGAYRDSGFGEAGKVVINDQLTMVLTGQRLEGIYVSGAGTDSAGNTSTSQVWLNNSDITLHGVNYAVRNDNSAIKLGKARAVGTGQGYLYSQGLMKIDASDAIGHAIKMAFSGSLLDADYDTSSADILANKSAIAVGVDDWGASTDSSGITAKFNNARLRTVSNTDALLLVDGGQQNVSFSFRGAGSDLLAASDGYLIDIVNPRASATPSSVDAQFSDGAKITGLTHMRADSTLTLGLHKQSVWTLAPKASDPAFTSTFTSLSMTQGSTLNAYNSAGTGTAAFVLKGDVNSSDASALNMQNGKAGDTLTIEGNYTGNNARLLVDSVWNNPNALTTDLLVVNGQATGMTTVSVPGGILGDVTQADQAKVSDKPVVIVSANHASPVFTGSADTTNAGQAQLSKVGNDYYWTLLARQSYRAGDGNGFSPSVPIYDSSVPGYVQAQRADLELGYAMLGTLHERVGEQQTWAWDGTDAAYQQARRNGQGKYPVWGRLEGQSLELNGAGRMGLKSTTGFMQFGTDLNVSFNPENGSRRHSGVMVSYGWGRVNFQDQDRAIGGVIVPDKFTGTARANMAALGAYSTYYQANGSYLDLVGQAAWIGNNFQSRAGNVSSQKGYGLALSAEVGRPWRLGGGKWQIEPQAQLIYQRVDLNGFDDGTRQMGRASLDGVRARLGARLAWNDRPVAQGGRSRVVYFTANILHDLSGNTPSIQIGRDRVSESYGRTFGELGIGAQWPLGKATAVYADARYRHALSGASSDAYAGHVGMRVVW